MIETVAGIVTALVIILLSQALSRYIGQKLFAETILIAIAFIYVGFSLKGNQVNSIILECGLAMVFYFLAIVGYKQNSLLIAFGIMLHGVWDILHHNAFFVKTDVPVYWPSFCLVVDIIDGLFFLFAFRSQKENRSVLKKI